MANGVLTLRYLRYWHTRINNQVYCGRLTRADIVLKRCKGSSGWCEKTYPCTITIDDRLSFRDARRVLVHEMTHQALLEVGYPGWWRHGPTFREWEAECLDQLGLLSWRG